MENMYLKSYFNQFGQGNPEILEELKEIASAYGLTIQEKAFLNTSKIVAMAYFMSLGFKHLNGLLVRDVTKFNEAGEEETKGWSCFKVTEVISKEITVIEGVGQDNEFPDIYEIPGADKPVIFNDIRTIAKVVLSGHGLPGLWKRAVIDRGIDEDGIKFISSALSMTGDITEEAKIDIDECFKAFILGNLPKNYLLFITDLTSNALGKYDIHMLTLNSPEEDTVFIKQFKELIHKWKTQNQE